jgi:hypothetical protein
MCSLQIVGDRLLFVDSNVLRIGADVALIEDAPREEIELFILQGA